MQDRLLCCLLCLLAGLTFACAASDNGSSTSAGQAQSDDDAGGATDDDNDAADDDDDNDAADDDNDDTSGADDYFTCSAGGLTSELLSGGRYSFGDLRLDSAGTTHLFATRSHRLVHYQRDAAGQVKHEVVACDAQYPSFTFDGDERLHVVFYDPARELMVYATNADGAWAQTELDPATPLSIDLDALGRVRVMARYGAEIMLYTKKAAGWESQIVFHDPSERVVATKVDREAWIHLTSVYYPPSKTIPQLTYYSNVGGLLSQRFATIGDASSRSLAVGVDGAVHLVYVNALGLPQHATDSSGSWESAPIGLQAAMPFAITLDADNRPVVGLAGDDIRVAQLGDDGWQFATALADAEHANAAALAIGADGAATMAFGVEDAAVTALLFAERDGEAWRSEIWEQAGYPAKQLSLAVSPDNAVHLINVNGLSVSNAGTFVFYTNEDGAWSRLPGGEANTLYLGQALAVDGAGQAAFAFYAQYAAEIRLAHQIGGVPVVEPITQQTGYFVFNNSLAYNQSLGRLAANDIMNHRLALVAESAKGWTVETIGGFDAPHAIPALALDADGRAHVAVVNHGTGRLFHLAQFGDGWASEILDENASNDELDQAQIGVDAAGAVHILYARCLDKAECVLSYVGNASGSWQSHDFADLRPESPAMAIDENGAVHFVVADAVSYPVIYGTNQSGDWVLTPIEKVTMGQSNGWRLAMALSADGMVHVAHGASLALWHVSFPRGWDGGGQ